MATLCLYDEDYSLSAQMELCNAAVRAINATNGGQRRLLAALTKQSAARLITPSRARDCRYNLVTVDLPVRPGEAPGLSSGRTTPRPEKIASRWKRSHPSPSAIVLAAHGYPSLISWFSSRMIFQRGGTSPAVPALGCDARLYASSPAQQRSPRPKGCERPGIRNRLVAGPVSPPSCQMSHCLRVAHVATPAQFLKVVPQGLRGP